MKLLIYLTMSIIANKTLTVKSPAFAHNEFIPTKYSCHGSNISPGLVITQIPQETKSLALVVDDPDAKGGTFDHWIMWNIPVQNEIHENTAPGMQGKNGKGNNKYTGPCPPSGLHHYHFRVYALSTKLEIPIGSDKATLLKAMEGHILATGEIVGLYQP